MRKPYFAFAKTNAQLISAFVFPFIDSKISNFSFSYVTVQAGIMRPYQGFWGFREKGHLFSGSWGALANILRDLGSKQ